MPEARNKAMSDEAITCPDCGLAVTIVLAPGTNTVNFGGEDWRQRCKRPELGGPLWCIIARDGTSQDPKQSAE